MKNLKYFLGALCICAVALVGCDKNEGGTTNPPVVTPEESVPEPEAPENGDYLVVVKFEGDVCNDIMWVGTSNGWTENPEEQTKFELYDAENYPGWYYVQFADTNEVVQGKPIQLKSDGTFSWDFQTGDVDSWTVKGGDVTIEAGYSGEANLTYNSKTAVMISAYWKNQKSPCVAIPSHEYTVNITAPEGSESVYIVGGFSGWDFVQMTKDGDVFTHSFNDEEGHEFKIVPTASWDDEAVYAADYNADDNCYNKAGNSILGVETTLNITVADWLSNVTVCEEASAE